MVPELDFGGFLVSPQLLDALADELGLDPLFERLDLLADAVVEVGDFITQALQGSVSGLSGGLLVGTKLAGELVEPHGAEDPLAEEALDEREQSVFADGQPLAVPFDLVGRDFAIGAPVVAGHVDVPLAAAPLHRESSAMEFCSLTEYPRGERLEIFGSEGTLVVDQVLDPPAVLYRGAEDLEGTPLEDVPYDIHGWKAESIRATALDFVEAVRDGREPRVTAADSKYVVSLVERAYESAARGGAALSGRPS